MQRIFGFVLVSSALLALAACNSATPAPKIDSFAAQPASVTRGDNVTLSWSVTGADPMALSIDNGVGDVSGKTKVTVAPSKDTTYTLTATDSAGSDTATAKVTVVTPPTITAFGASPNAISSGGNATLSWSVTGSDPLTLTIDNGVGDVSGRTSVSVSPSATTTYTLTASNSAGSVTDQATVTVGSVGPGVSVATFSATPDPVAAGQQTTFSWSLSGASGTLTCALDPGDGSASLTVNDCANTTSQAYTYTAAGSYPATLSVQGTTATGATSVTVMTPPAIASFDASPSTITAGGSSTLSWTVSGSGPVSLSIDNGVGDVSGQTSVSVSPVSAGDITYTLTATNAVGSATSQTTLTVNAATPPTIASFDASPSTITAGGSTLLTWSVSGSTPLSLSIDNGVGDVSGQTSVSVSPTASTTYTLTASNAGGTVTAQTNVTVNAVTGTTVTVTKQGTVPWIAYQDGVGAWQALSGTSFTVSDAGGRYGVAWECTPPGGSGQPRVTVYQATTSESASVTTWGCQASTTNTLSYTLSGTITGISSGGQAEIAVAGGSAVTVTEASPQFSLNVTAGTHTLLAYGFDGSLAPTSMVRTTVDVTGDTTGYDVDLSTGQAFGMGTMTLSNVPTGEDTHLGVNLVPGGESGSLFLNDSSQSASTAPTTLSYAVVPTLLGQNGDLYAFSGQGYSSVTVCTGNSCSMSSGDMQMAGRFEHDPTNPIDVPLPPVMPSTAGIQPNGTTATVDWGSLLFSGSGGASAYMAAVTPASATSPGYGAIASAGWLGASTTYTVPDFSSTSGWDAAWDFPQSQTAYGSWGALNSNLLSLNALFESLANPSAEPGPGFASLQSGTSFAVTEHFDPNGTY